MSLLRSTLSLARTVTGEADSMLRARGRHAVDAPGIPVLHLLALLVLGSMTYGAVMGFAGGKPEQALYSALKVPLFLIGATLVCLPSFYVVNMVLGLGEDFLGALRGIICAQTTLAVTLAALAPITAFVYVSNGSYHVAKLLNGVMFGLASIAAQRTLARHYRPLLARNKRHRAALVAWPAIYIFVALQLAYALRPFVGNPRFPTEFLRDDWWGNVYIDLTWAVRGALGL